jgi:hypothetical protein
MEPTNPPYLYLLVRNDLQSLNAGKAVAHGAHAANLFMWNMERMMRDTVWNNPAQEHQSKPKFWSEYLEWLGEVPEIPAEHRADGFGTTIALSVNKPQLETVVNLGLRLGFSAGLAWDPSYPYDVDAEVAKLIERVEAYPLEYPPIYKGARATCFRREVAAGYIFGRKDDLRPLLQNFPLMP